jgi:CBS domain-containing protein
MGDTSTSGARGTTGSTRSTGVGGEPEIDLRSIGGEDEPSVLHRDEVVRTAAAVMRDRCIGDVLVIDDAGALCGIVTDRDVALRVVAAGLDPATTAIGEVATPDPVAVPVGGTVADVAAVMRDHAVRRVPVVDTDRRPVGVVALSDLATDLGGETPLARVLHALATAPPDF